MQAASASINKLLGVQTLTTSQQKLALVSVWAGQPEARSTSMLADGGVSVCVMPQHCAG